MLSEADRHALWARFMEEASVATEPIELTKVELRAAVDAIDQWIDVNASSFNLAIPLPARTVLTQEQKLRIFKAVLNRRWEEEE